MRSVSLIFPCYNERDAIPEVFRRLRDVRGRLHTLDVDLEVIVVDDASSDGSEALLREETSVVVIRHDRRRGYGAALKTGFAAARGEWISFMDLDRTYRSEDLPLLLERTFARDLDMAYGRRSFMGSGMPGVRSLGNFIFTGLVRFLAGSALSDVCTGFRVFHRRRRADILSLPSDGLHFSMELTLASLLNGWRVDEIAIPYEERLGASKLHAMADGLRFLWMILSAQRIAR